jgi:uncharacterized membrane protein YvbJ
MGNLQKFCSNCGNQLSPNDIFCPRCGNHIGPQSETNPPAIPPKVPAAVSEKKPNSGSKNLVIVLISLFGILIVVLVGVFLLLFFRKSSDTEAPNSAQIVRSELTAVPDSSGQSVSTESPNDSEEIGKNDYSFLKVDLDQNSCTYDELFHYSLKGTVTNTSKTYNANKIYLTAQVYSDSGQLIGEYTEAMGSYSLLPPGSQLPFLTMSLIPEVQRPVCKVYVSSAEVHKK